MNADRLTRRRLPGSVLASWTYYYDGDGNPIAPDAIVNGDGSTPPTERDSDAATVFPSSTPRADDKAAPTGEGSRLQTYTYDRINDESLGPCRCGGQHPDGRFLSHDPVGFCADDPNVYRYVADVPPPREDEPT
jgi:hypothetical protein